MEHIDTSSDDEEINLRKCKSDDEVVRNAAINKSYKLTSETVNIDSFEMKREIGKGAYGKVWLVKKKDTGEEYAMKMIRFSKTVTESFAQNLLNERNIFGVVSGEHVVTALYVFVHKNYICFIMECMYGGDFRGILEEECCIEELEIARPYVAELVLAIEY